MSDPQFPLKIYGAGPLFWEGELIWNALIAPAVAKLSKGRYEFVLPQETETPNLRSTTVKNKDLHALVLADGISCNYSLNELDAGTVVEHIIASELFHPTVLYRGDIRKGGDQLIGAGEGDSPDWNLMASSWSRTISVWWNSMARLQLADAELNKAENDPQATAALLATKMTDRAATEIVAGLDRSFLIPFSLDKDELRFAFNSLMRRADGLADFMVSQEGMSLSAILERFLERKMAVQAAMEKSAPPSSKFSDDVHQIGGKK